MRLAVLDVGSNTVHLLVVDAHPGARPIPATSHREILRLAEYLDEDGNISPSGEASLTAFVAEAVVIAEDQGAEDMLAFATSAVRDAPNGEALLARVKEKTGVELQVLPGGDEARLTFLAVRRWFGWSAGRILLLDIGGGSLEIASGPDETPDTALSLPLGAGRLTKDFLPGDPPDADSVAELRRYARAHIGRVAHRVSKVGQPDRVVASSKTFRSLARIAGAAPSADGIYAVRKLKRRDLAAITPRLAEMSAEERAGLPGVSGARARQLLAGAIVAEAAMDIFDVKSLEICPWALREGIILRRLDVLQG